MDLAARNQPTSIPLRCNLCPKKPNFSDLSHLLTHISSKSHLAHRFKVELKARTDRQAYEDVREYDEWCERYGINALLADRMAAKEQKKNPNSKRVRGANQTVSCFPTQAQSFGCMLTSDSSVAPLMPRRAASPQSSMTQRTMQPLGAMLLVTP